MNHRLSPVSFVFAVLCPLPSFSQWFFYKQVSFFSWFYSTILWFLIRLYRSFTFYKQVSYSLNLHLLDGRLPINNPYLEGLIRNIYFYSFVLISDTMQKLSECTHLLCQSKISTAALLLLNIDNAKSASAAIYDLKYQHTSTCWNRTRLDAGLKVR